MPRIKPKRRLSARPSPMAPVAPSQSATTTARSDADTHVICVAEWTDCEWIYATNKPPTRCTVKMYRRADIPVRLYITAYTDKTCMVAGKYFMCPVQNADGMFEHLLKSTIKTIGYAYDQMAGEEVSDTLVLTCSGEHGDVLNRFIALPCNPMDYLNVIKQLAGRKPLQCMITDTLAWTYADKKVHYVLFNDMCVNIRSDEAILCIPSSVVSISGTAVVDSLATIKAQLAQLLATSDTKHTK